MNNEKKIETSTAVGGITLFVSCYGISIYDQTTHDSYTNHSGSPLSRTRVIKYKYVKEFHFCVIFLAKKFILSMIIRIFVATESATLPI